MGDLEPFLGTVAVLAVLVGAVWLMLRCAAAHEILLPVAVGLGLRLVVMLAAHFGSVWSGDDGFMYRDDRGYDAMARVIAEHWRAGEIVNPAREDIAGTYIYGYPAFLGLVFTIAGSKMLLAKAINVVFSAATVLLGALLGERLLGRQALRRTAWLLALMPTLVWWSAPLMKEAGCAFLFVACLLALTHFFRPWATAAFSIAFLVLAMTRTTLSVAFGLAGIALVAVLGFRERGHPAMARLAVVAVLVAGIPALSVVLQGQGQVGAVVNAYRSTANNEIEQYREASVGLGGHSFGDSVRIVVREVPKSLVAPYPWAFDKGAATWDRALYPGMWVWYVLIPTAAFGLWRWRRRPELWLLVATVLPYLTVNVLTSGFQFRQRSSVEPVFLLFVVAGLVSWRQALRWGAYALLAVAVGAAIQSRGAIAPAAIALGAGAVWLASGRVRGPSVPAVPVDVFGRWFERPAPVLEAQQDLQDGRFTNTNSLQPSPPPQVRSRSSSKPRSR
jgi:hypothetical protein